MNHKLNHKNSRKWAVLGMVAAALLVIPRRSSRKSDSSATKKGNVKPDTVLSNDITQANDKSFIDDK